MALATYRNNDTGDLIELSEDWLDRFPRDPYTRLTGDELAKLEKDARTAAAAAIGAQPYQQPEDAASDPTPPAAAATDDEDEDTPTPAPAQNPRSESRF